MVLNLLLLVGALELPARGMAAGSPVVSPEARETEAASLRRGDAYFHLMKARIAAGQGEAAEAMSEIREANALAPESADLHAESASILYHIGRRGEADRMARRSLELNSEQGTALRVLADLAATKALASDSDKAAREEAIRLHERLSERSDADADLFMVLARLKRMAGDTAGAAEAARAYAARRPGEPGAVRLLFQMLLQDGRDSEALHALADHLPLDPKPDELIGPFGSLARKTGEWTVVERTCSRILDADASQSAARALRGEALLRLDRPREAVADLERARDLLPDEPLVRYHLVNAYSETGRLADSVAVARDLVREFPGHAGVQAVLGEVLARQGDDDGALTAFEAALKGFDSQDAEDSRRRDEMRRRIAVLDLARGRKERAREALLALENPADLESLEIRARAALESGQIEEARSLAARVRAGGDPGLAALLEGEILLRESRLGKARARFGEAAASLGPEAWPRVAQLYRREGYPAEGERVLREWSRAEPASSGALFHLGAYLEQESRHDEAEATLGAALRLDPNNGEALNYLGYSLADRNLRLDEALAFVLRAVEIDPWNGAYLDSLGWVYYRMGKHEDARAYLERAAREFPRDPEVLEHLGDVCERLGDRPAAVAAWKRALEAAPDRSEALRSKIDAAADRAAVPPSR